MILAEMVRAIGHVALPAADISFALRLWELDRNGFDVAIIDYHLVEGLGVSLAAQLLSEKPTLRVILVSGLPEASIDVPPGAMFLEKPFTPQELKALIEGG